MKRRTGLFLGAGASYEAGMPLASKLIAEIKNLLRPAKLRQLNAEWQLQGAGYPDEVIEDLVGMLVRPDVHYEAALGFMEVQFRRHRLQQEHLYSLLVELVSIFSTIAKCIIRRFSINASRDMTAFGRSPTRTRPVGVHAQS